MSAGLLFVISSPSGAGKTTLCRRLQADHPDLRFSVSFTTRLPRPGEIDGRDYHFVTGAVFDQMIQEGAFAEWAHVHDRRYGTARRTVQAALQEGQAVLFDIDYQGAERLAAQFPGEARLVFILPPSMAVLAQRLRGRGTDSPEMIARRLHKAREELSHYGMYHYLVENDDLARGYAELSAIYLVERGPLDSESAALARSCETARRAHLAQALLQEQV